MHGDPYYNDDDIEMAEVTALMSERHECEHEWKGGHCQAEAFGRVDMGRYDTQWACDEHASLYLPGGTLYDMMRRD